MELRNVRIYSPEKKPYGDGFLYFCSEDGQDFYESQDKFTKKYKLCIDSGTGIIRSVAEDVSRLYPAGFSVVEVDELPDGFDIFGGWQYQDGVVVTVPDFYEQKAETRRRLLLAEAEKTTSEWKTELGLGTISEDDRERLAQWMPYIKSLKGMSFSGVKDRQTYGAILWPEKPILFN